MKRIVIVRQRPAIGDALLLGPLIREVKAKFPKATLTVVTDPLYMAGALPTIFSGIPGVDRVEHIPMQEWTDMGNKRIDSGLLSASDEVPETIKRADLVLYCNSGFISFEREHSGHPPYGIAEFWCKEHGFFHENMDLLPKFEATSEMIDQAHDWLVDRAPGKEAVGVVLAAGDPVRDWNYENIATRVVDWLHTSGYAVVTIDPYRTMQSNYVIPCVGQRLDFVAGVIANLELVLTPDTGLLHLSQALGTKTVSMWGIMEPELRMQGYDTVVVPKQCQGFCQSEADLRHCQCRWKFQQWSCLRRLTLNQIIAGLEEALHARKVERDTNRRGRMDDPHAASSN